MVETMDTKQRCNITLKNGVNGRSKPVSIVVLIVQGWVLWQYSYDDVHSYVESCVELYLLLVSDMFNECGLPSTQTTKNHPFWEVYLVLCLLCLNQTKYSRKIHRQHPYFLFNQTNGLLNACQNNLYISLFQLFWARQRLGLSYLNL